MKRALLSLLVTVVVIGAIALALKPAAVNQYKLWREAKVVGGYREAAAALDTLTCGERVAEARETNGKIRQVDLPDVWDEAYAWGEDAEAALLDIADSGAITVLEIPKLGLILPVVRGRSGELLDEGVAHLEGSSLPVGGEGTHCVLAGQAGGRLSNPMDGLERLMAGDLFTLQTLRDTLTYEVESLETLAPEALQPQRVDAEADVCTLMTAIDLDGEDARLLVRARRVQRRAVPLEDDTQVLPGWAARLIFAAPLALAGLLVLAFVEAIRRFAGWRKLKKLKL